MKKSFRHIKDQVLNFSFDGEFVYKIGFLFYFVFSFLETTTFLDYFGRNTLHRLSYIGLSFILFKIFFIDKQKLSNFIFNILMLGLLVITWRTSGEFLMLPMGLFILGARDVKFRTIIKLYLGVGTIILLSTLTASLLGVIKNLTYHRGETSVIRQSFGIMYPTDFAAHVFYLVLAYAYLNFKKLSWRSYVIFVIVAWLLIKFCDARLSAYSMIILIPVMIIGQKASVRWRAPLIIANFYWSIPVVLGYVTSYLSYFYSENNHIFFKLNNLLSGRLVFGHEALKEYPINLFGQRVVEHGWGGIGGMKMASNSPSNYFFIDSSYLRVLILYGIIVAVLLLMVMTIISYRSVSRGSYALASIIVMVAISSVVEQRLYNISYDPFLIALFANLYSSKLGGIRREAIHTS